MANAYLTVDELSQSEVFYPLKPLVCERCLLVQVPQIAAPEVIFKDYAYLSGQSAGWVEHCHEYAAAMIERFDPCKVLELASNDGTLLRAFSGCEVLGVEPADNVSWIAQLNGIPTISEFFGVDLASRLVAGGYRADLVVANNVLAHVPNLSDFVQGVSLVLADGGVATFEFPHIAELISKNQFDTIYHEHFSYFSFGTAVGVLARNGLTVFDVERLPIHGGSLRLYARKTLDHKHMAQGSLAAMFDWEADNGYNDLSTFTDYAAQPPLEKSRALSALSGLREQGLTIAGYGAPAKFNTFANYCGIGTETVEFVVDSTPSKQGTYLPGSRIPVYAPERLQEARPDVVWITPWNWASEIAAKITQACDWGPLVICRPL